MGKNNFMFITDHLAQYIFRAQTPSKHLQNKWAACMGHMKHTGF